MQELYIHPDVHQLQHLGGCDCDRCLLAYMTSPVLHDQQKGWEAWYHRDGSALATYLARRCRSVGCLEQSEDLMQDCFVIGFRNIVSGAYVDRGCSLLAYLYGIAKNLVRETVKVQRQEFALDDLPEQEVTTEAGLSIDDLLYLRDVVALVQGARHRQPPLQQTILFGHYTEGKSSRELALQLRQSAGNTRIIALRAVNEIQRYLQQQHHTQISPEAIRICLSREEA